MLSFDLQDKLFDLFIEDAEFLALLSNPDGPEELNSRFRREDLLPELLNDQSLPFIAFYFIDTNQTKNMLMNKGVLQFDIYAQNRQVAMLIYKKIRQILQNNFEDMQIKSEGQIPSGIVNIFKYRVRFAPIINS